MENYKIDIKNGLDITKATVALHELGYVLGDLPKNGIYFIYAMSDKTVRYVTCSDGYDYHGIEAKDLSIAQLHDMVVLHRNDVSDATHEDNGNRYYVTSDDKLYGFLIDSWVLSPANRSPTFKPINKQPDAVASPNDIARTAEVHREHNLANELNDLCAEFGCLPGQNRMAWLRDRLRATKKPRGTETLYHYSASINTARGTVAYDGVITCAGRIMSIEDYQDTRAEIAKDGNVAPEQVNVHSLSIVN